MTSVEDFTGLALGSDVALEGRVSRCPRCGRNGIEQGRGEKLSYSVIHKQTSRVFGDGMLTEPSDFCVLPDSHPAAAGQGEPLVSEAAAPPTVQRPAAGA